MRLITIFLIMVALMLSGCATVTPEMIKIEKDVHESIVQTAKLRMEYISCDLGLIDGLGIANIVDFPIQTAEGARAILANPAISLTLAEMKGIARRVKKPDGQVYWDDNTYDMCKVTGLSYRALALSTIDVLRLFPQLVPYMAIFGM
jgi:uncharacterized protein YceK